MSPSSRVPYGRALRQGGSATFSSWPAYLTAFGAEWVGLLALSAMSGLLWLLLSGAGLATAALGAVGLWLLWLTAQLVSAIATGVALDQAAARLMGKDAPDDVTSASVTAPTSLAWFGSTIVFQTLRAAWQWLALATTGVAFVSALLTGRHGVAHALLLALAVTVCLALGIALWIWLELAWTRAITRRESFWVALFESAGTLWADPLRPLGAAVLSALVAGGFGALIAFAPGQLVSPGGVRGLWLAGALIGSGCTAFILTGAAFWRLGVFAALELDRTGELPRPPPARAELILEAEPIVDARPLPDASTP